ncbi:SLAM family member 5-like isoform X2 [Macrotis lagotis]|uniref:SLAM family member 5-like isoform X2 n=1 Tax=Macrotis lagotis TaxID=92651 RepID=UPI003D6860EB
MAQPDLWFLVLFLFIEPRASKENDAAIKVIGILGESAILPAEIPAGHKIENINWSSRTPVALMQPEGTSVRLIPTHQNYRGRLTAEPETFNLKISPLKMEDTGPYRADMNLQTSTTNITITKNYTLQVYRRLTPPKITLNTIASENNTCNITLTCFVEEGEVVEYQWTALGEQVVESSGNFRLFILQRPEDAHINYTCTVTNPVSNNSHSILVKYFCSEKTRASTLLWLILVPLLILTVLAGIYFHQQHNKKKGAVSPSTFRKDPLPHTGNTVYDEIIIPKATVPKTQKEESPNTIYYTVQNPQKVENSFSSASKLLGTSANESVI